VTLPLTFGPVPDGSFHFGSVDRDISNVADVNVLTPCR